MTDKIYMVPNPPTPSNGMKFNPEICTGCNRCVEVCPDDVFMPNPEKKETADCLVFRRMLVLRRLCGRVPPAGRHHHAPSRQPEHLSQLEE